MSKCDHCPSLFHTSSQCKLKPKVLARTPSEEISKSRIEDYFVFSDKVHESQMKKLVSPFSFSIDSLADKDGFYIDKEGSGKNKDAMEPIRNDRRDGRDYADQSFHQQKEGDQRNYSSRNYEVQRKDNVREPRGNTNNGKSKSVNDRLDNTYSSNARSERSRSFNQRLDHSSSIDNRLDNARSVNDRLKHFHPSMDRLDNSQSFNRDSSRYHNQRLDHQNHKLDNAPTITQRLDHSQYFSRRIDDLESMKDLNFTIQNDHSESNDSRKSNGYSGDHGYNPEPHKESGKAPPAIHTSVHKRLKGDDEGDTRQNNHGIRDSQGYGRSDKGNYPRNTELQRDIHLKESSGNSSDKYRNSFDSSMKMQEPSTKFADKSARNGVSNSSNSVLRTVTPQEEGIDSNYSRIIIDIDSNEDSSSLDVRIASPVKETVHLGQSKSAVTMHDDSLVIMPSNPSCEKLSTPSMKSSRTVEISSKNNDKSPSASIDVMIDSVTSNYSSSSPKDHIATVKEIPEIKPDLKNLRYHLMKYEMKRRNAYSELDASISLEISKMNSTISELELLLFENSPKLVEDTSSIMNRLKTQKDCFKHLKDIYLKKLHEIEDQESTFLKDNYESLNSTSRKRDASEADLISEDVDISEKAASKISLNSSPFSKKDRINQEYVPSIFEDSFHGFPANPKEQTATYNISNGLSSISSILDGKPRSALFPNDKIIDSLDGILFSTTLENKLQVWDMQTFSPIKSVSFHGEREKTDKVSLPEDMCWVSPNSILISSKGTDKVQDQPWNNLTLLYDLRRSAKTGGFKYKILNFKEHGHGAISAIKGLSITSDKATHWVTGGINKKIFYWTIGDLTADTTLDSKVLINEHTSAVTAFHYCTHKGYVYSGGLDGKVFGFNLDGVIQSSFSIKPKKIRNIHQIGSSPSTLLVSATDRESEFLIYDALSNAPVMQFGSKKELTNADEKVERVRSLYQNSAVHPNGYLICMGDHNTSKINMWDIRRPNIPLHFDVHDKGQTDRGKSKYLSLVLGFHTSGGKQFLYSLGSDKRIVRIDLNSVF